ncbi:hypothetical protein HETIRDRAFT_104299 [Heterobasidion irregulare TC 32-1]|uniref:Uncharacterized protein n=1 Tax=Heterobasidion irregulare (strain TC 32-1) TaxID=747525 RepID=W4K1L0_HETIT|nr:uncharacterized protein HETIRDRAFT_104299 [Heterobasidion irregulare TC 32-1]ETW78976.1 hypothetical protein HETIRDRAFT_104299 [Heterobasidion irregulare TC 32-1]
MSSTRTYRQDRYIIINPPSNGTTFLDDDEDPTWEPPDDDLDNWNGDPECTAADTRGPRAVAAIAGDGGDEPAGGSSGGCGRVTARSEHPRMTANRLSSQSRRTYPMYMSTSLFIPMSPFFLESKPLLGQPES